MRQLYFKELELGQVSVEDIKIPTHKRDEIYKLLRGLQYIYSQPGLLEKIFSILQEKIKLTKMGAPGMSLWEILVLGVLKLGLDADYDRIDHIINNDNLVRKMLMVDFMGGEQKAYGLQTLKDNVRLLDEEMLIRINELVVNTGHEIKKEGSDKLQISAKVDSFVVETNVHFPTDYNLLWDSSRKAIETTQLILSQICDSSGWRKIKSLKEKIKKLYEKVRRCSRRGGKNKERDLKSCVRGYLQGAKGLSKKLRTFRDNQDSEAINWEKWDYYVLMTEKHIDLTYRRIIKGEVIPHEEKVFSIFEDHTEWINKGKSNNRVELGIKTAIATDQFGFILYHRVMPKEQDVDITVLTTKELLKKYSIKSISFDKGFWSKGNYEELKGPVGILIMPKKGKRNKAESEREQAPGFVKLRKEHSAVESNINALEHNGVSVCRDHGIKSFHRHVALGVLAYNLHKLGTILLERDKNRYRLAG